MRTIILLSGALASSIGIAAETAESPKPDAASGSELALVVDGHPDFTALTPGSLATSVATGMLLGGFAGGVAQSAVAQSKLDAVASTGIADPADALALALAPYVASKVGASTIGNLQHQYVKFGLEDTSITVSSPNEPVLHVKTAKWGIRFEARKPGTYEILYGTRVKLSNVARGISSGEASCSYSSSDKGALTSNQLFADDGARLKTGFADAIEYCTRVLRTRLFGADALPLEEAMTLVDSDEPHEVQMAARTLYAQTSLSADQLDTIANTIAMAAPAKNKGQGDSLAWLCKVLGKSGNGRYKPFLTSLAAADVDPTLKRYADAAAKQLPVAGADAYQYTAPKVDAATSKQGDPQAREKTDQDIDAALAKSLRQVGIEKAMVLLGSTNTRDLQEATRRLSPATELTRAQLDKVAAVINDNQAATDSEMVIVVVRLCDLMGANDFTGRYQPFLMQVSKKAPDFRIQNAADAAAEKIPRPKDDIYSPPPNPAT